MPQHKFRQTLKKLERKGIKVIEKSEKNTTKVGEKISALVGLDAHKCSALAFCIKVKKLMLLSVVSSGRWKPERRVKERKAGRPLTLRAENDDALGVASG